MDIRQELIGPLARQNEERRNTIHQDRARPKTRLPGLRDRPIDIRTKVTAYFLGMECLLLYGFIFFYGSLLL